MTLRMYAAFQGHVINARVCWMHVTHLQWRRGGGGRSLLAVLAVIQVSLLYISWHISVLEPVAQAVFVPCGKNSLARRCGSVG